MDRSDITYFDRNREFQIFDRHLPHWMQSGGLYFVTWRLADTLPAEVLIQIDKQIQIQLISLGLDPNGDRALQLGRLDARERSKLNWRQFMIRDKFLDSGYGSCLLRDPEIAGVVRDSLLNFDGDRYFMTDLVVMPNHLHYLAAFPDERLFLKQNTDWKRFIARTINKKLGRTGDFWQTDQFDHLVRSESHFEYFRKYIRENPKAAGLPDNEYLWFSKLLE